MDTATIARWPGKVIEGKFHPALWHMLDVGAVTAQLLNHAPITRKSAWDQACNLLIALHDFGKISAAFQAQIMGGSRTAFHTDLGFILLEARCMARLCDRFRCRPRVLAELLAAVTGHHGGPPALYEENDLHRFSQHLGDQAPEDAVRILEAIIALFPNASLEGLQREEAKKLSWALSGLTVQADWIGSNADWFPSQPPSLSVEEYWQGALERAAHATRMAGLHTSQPRSGAEALTARLELRPMQAVAQGTELDDGPLLALIEDATGAGKTEAALILASRMMNAGKGNGVFFALPTMATSNAMLSRMEAAATGLFDGRPSLALSHGRSRQNTLFRDILGRDGTDPAEPVSCGAWLADDRRRILLADIAVGTIDQALLGVLPTRFNTLRLRALSQKILIVDEAHSYDPYMEAELQRLLRFQAAMGGSAIVMTATLPRAMRNGFANAFRSGLGRSAVDLISGAYPCFSRIGAKVDSCQPDPVPATCRTVQVGRVNAEQAHLDICEAAQAGAACLWVRNAFDDAIDAVQDLRAAGVAADLLHARYTVADRLRLETEVQARFGKTGSGRAGRVLVATQVVEASLDLDFDVMVSDLAPIGALIQGAGRLWRHMDVRPVATRPVPGPELKIVSPDPSRVETGRWLHSALNKGAWVYPQDLQWRTARAVFDTGAIQAPDGLRALIEAGHGGGAPDVPEALAAAETERLGQMFSERTQAQSLLMKPEDGYLAGAQRIYDEDRLSTRLGAPQVTLRLARPGSEGLEPFQDSWAQSEIQVSRARFERAGGLDQDSPDI